MLRMSRVVCERLLDRFERADKVAGFPPDITEVNLGRGFLFTVIRYPGETNQEFAVAGRRRWYSPLRTRS